MRTPTVSLQLLLTLLPRWLMPRSPQDSARVLPACNLGQQQGSDTRREVNCHACHQLSWWSVVFDADGFTIKLRDEFIRLDFGGSQSGWFGKLLPDIQRSILEFYIHFLQELQRLLAARITDTCDAQPAVWKCQHELSTRILDF